MGYFVIIIFTTFLGSPPEFLPIAFKTRDACENYLTLKALHKYQYMRLEVNEETRYLVNISKNKFITCNKLKYPTTSETNIVKTSEK